MNAACSEHFQLQKYYFYHCVTQEFFATHFDLHSLPLFILTYINFFVSINFNPEKLFLIFLCWFCIHPQNFLS